MSAQPLIRHTLDNGLRVMLDRRGASGVVGVAVHYDVGFRSEPPSRTGFAHLFEHLMFQGSESLPKLEHSRVVQSSGGVFNGSTHTDYTDYFEVLPSSAVERGLFLEADRMRAPALTAENLANQVDVVSEEIRLNVLSRPYGGFPWILLPPVLFTTFANTHDGYGAFEDLQSATLDDCADFFETYYCPANAVLTVSGDFDPDEVACAIEKHFADIPYRPRPARPSFAEPRPESRRFAEHHDELAPLPALCLGWHSPDPAQQTGEYLSAVLLASILADGESARLQAGLARSGMVTEIWAGIGLLGSAFDARDPDVFTISSVYPSTVALAEVEGAVTDALLDLAANGPTPSELTRAVARLRAGLHQGNDSVSVRCRSVGALEVLLGRAELLDEVPDMAGKITCAEIAALAQTLTQQTSAVLSVQPAQGGAQ